MTENAPRLASAADRHEWVEILATAAPALCCLVLLAQAVHAVAIPIGEHNDSRTILDVVPSILGGHYQRSRSFGVPLYEVIVSGLVGLGGTLLANFYSLALAIGSVFAFNHLLGRDLAPVRRILALVAFALNPIFVSNSTMLIEWMQVVFFLLCLLLAAAAVRRTRSGGTIACYAVASVACVLTRPDLCLFCGALFLVLLWETRDMRLAVKLAVANAIAGAITVAIFLWLNDVKDLATAITVEDRELWRRVALAIVDGVALLGIVGSVAALVLLAAILWDLVRRVKSPSFDTKLLLLVLPLIVARQIGLPSKVEFLFPLLIVFLLAVARDGRGTAAFGLMAASLALGSVLQVSLLERTGSGDALHLRVGLHPGAVAQDFDRRVQNTSMFDPAYLTAIAKASYGTDGAIPKLEAREFFPGLISDSNDLVIGAPALYQLDNPRFAFEGTRRMFGGNGDSRRSAYRHIYVCDKSVAAAGKGWRTLQPPTPIARLDAATGGVDTKCALE